MRILFACLAADGHFNPLTGFAVHLARSGHDVRWYTGASLADKLERLGIPLLPFRRAVEITGENIPTLFPERARLRGPKLIRFDGEKIMFSNAGAFFEDVREINEQFAFDLLFCDAAFYGARLIKEILGKRVVALDPGPEPLDDAPNLPPNFMGLKPAKTLIGRSAYRAMKFGFDRMVYRHLHAAYNRTLQTYGVEPIAWSVLDETYHTAEVTFLNGVPGLTYPREHPNPKIVFAGACHPYRDPARPRADLPVRLGRYHRTVLISQGTVDNVDPNKLMIPALEAMRDSDCLLLVATGGQGTEGLRRLYPAPNVVIEDWIDFDAVLPHVDVFICNGGSGSLLLSMSHGVPMVGAGIREGKNDNNAHIEYLGLGINLRTEKPGPPRIRQAVDTVLREPRFRLNAARVRLEIQQYNPHQIVDAALASLPVSR